MEISISGNAGIDLSMMDSALNRLFFMHFEKMKALPPRRHLKFGLPYWVENVAQQARCVYGIEGNIIHIVRCFATHKEYENWYKSFR